MLFMFKFNTKFSMSMRRSNNYGFGFKQSQKEIPCIVKYLHRCKISS